MTGTNKSPCRKRRLAQRGSFLVDDCACGAVHLTIGYLTIRLERAAYAEMAEAIGEALTILRTPDQLPQLFN
ncbi:MAG TPA: hypothetical protein VFB15_01930 [Candidatus Binataceae bacterium]|jgi:hypothetical protein|nr:hypothetical protein [Candidatus Binataceae bacterium]